MPYRIVPKSESDKWITPEKRKKPASKKKKKASAFSVAKRALTGKTTRRRAK